MTGAPEPVDPQVIDVRLVRQPDGRWRTTVEGTSLGGFTHPCPAGALEKLGQLVHAISRMEDRSEVEVLTVVFRDPSAPKRLAERALNLIFGAILGEPPPARPADVLDETPPEKHA